MIDTPDNLYCKLPQDSPIAVRGARNYPCMGHPGKRAPTVEICNSDKPYEPLAQRQHALGPYPLDPNLLSQGVPLDDRVTVGDNIFGPVEGTPLPPGSPGPPAPTEVPPPRPDTDFTGVMPTEPNAFNSTGSGVQPSVAVMHYDPGTGRYVTPDGHLYRQSDLMRSKSPKTWKDMLITSV